MTIPPLTTASRSPLMQHRVEEVLLVASEYDSYILEQDGHFADLLFGRYLELELTGSPAFRTVSSGEEALTLLRERPFDMVLATPHSRDLAPLALARRVKEISPDLPVVLLAYDRATAEGYAAEGLRYGGAPPGPRYLDHVLLWAGDPNLLIGVVKCIEDAMNVAADTANAGVRVILLVENDSASCSRLLPALYTEVLTQTRSLIPDGFNAADRLRRLRMRPRILLVRSAEEALDALTRYGDHLLGVVTDLGFPRGGQTRGDEALDLVRRVRDLGRDIPILLHSSDQVSPMVARALGVDFVPKDAPDQAARLHAFIHTRMGFGPFVFRDPQGRIVGQADDLAGLVRVLEQVPAESILAHGARHDISHWVMARGEIAIADQLRAREVGEFAGAEAIRRYLLDVFTEHFDRRQRGQVTEFVRTASRLGRDFTRLGSGSMGGKARGIAFLSHRLADHPVHDRHPGVRIRVPRTTVLCTDVFDEFCRTHDLVERTRFLATDDEVARLFLSCPLSDELMADLGSLLTSVRGPMAVRSSSLTEDSEVQPLAGLYQTVLIPNGSPSDAVRLRQLAQAVRLVWASTFFRDARVFQEAASQGPGEERMAVILQQVVGRRRGNRFYPNFAGVAQSYNYYPIRYMRPEDGIATVALGLGHTVVDGGRALRFCPRHPQVLPQMSPPSEALRNSQQEFRALDLDRLEAFIEGVDPATLVRLPLDVAERDGTLAPVGATWSPENDRIYDSVHQEGIRLVNFAGILKYDRFPLAPLLADVLDLGSEGLGTRVEMEFAGNLADDQGPAELALVQIRPMASAEPTNEVDLGALGRAESLVLQGAALGNGRLRGIRDVVYVHPSRYRPAETRRMAREVGGLNETLSRAHRPYLLVAPGRWGTSDPWLGIPVSWAQVSGARCIAELVVPGYAVDPSLGTHFFHNITSLHVGYFTVDLARLSDVADLTWFESLPAERETPFVRHVHLPDPLEARIDGRVGRGLVVRVGE